MKKGTTKTLVLTALFTALVLIFTLFIRIPLPFGYVNLGDAFVLLSVFILGPVYGTVAAGLGSCLADLFGYIVYVPGTLVIKTLAALVVWGVYRRLFKMTKMRTLSETVAGFVGAVIMTAGYFFYEWLFFTTAAVAILNAPWNLLQGSVGAVVAVIVGHALVVTKVLDKPQKHEK